jgi:hypothetical protein
MQTIDRENKIKNSMIEGQNILRAGMFNGRKLSKSELWCVRLSVENAMAKLGISRLQNKTFTITNVTPAGY